MIAQPLPHLRLPFGQAFLPGPAVRSCEILNRRRTYSVHTLVEMQNPRVGLALPNPGDVIAGKYAVTRRLGEGGMAVVFEATHIRLRQRLAIKVQKPDVPEFEQSLARFEREARATAQLRSIHAARTVDVDTLPNGLPYMVMEYLEGNDLDVQLSKHGAFPIDQAVDVALQVASAMQEAHALAIVHRDLKPSNLFMCPVGDRMVVKVLDFGISKIENDGDARLTASDAYFGTPAYASPEQIRDAGTADARSDIWSLGIILFELLTGRTPFEGSAVSVIAKVMTDPVPWPITLRPDLPPDLARIVLHALERDPRARFQTMKEMAEALAPFGPARSAATLVADAQRGRGRLGEILVAEQLITQADLELALAEQRSSGKLLGRVLLDLGLVAHSDLLIALAKQQGIGESPAPPAIIDRKRAERHVSTVPPMTPRAPSKRRWLWIAIAVGVPLGILCGVGASLSMGSHAHPVSSSVGR
jgi:serine/threonine protein kinase